MSVDFSKIFEPISIGGVTLKNRIMMSPMEVGMGESGGFVSERLIEYMKERAANDVAIIITGSVGVSPEGRGLATQLSCYDDKFIPGLKKLTDAVHEAGGKIGAQIYHAGRQASEQITGLQPIAPSPIPCPIMQGNPREMTEEDIRIVRQKFVDGAKRLEKAGFDIIEVHLAHGYLLHGFLSPFSNKRTDQYGGNLENRLRFPRQVVKSIIESVKVPVTIRISAEEFIEDGLHIDEVIEICRILEQDGIKAISVSAGSYGSLPWVIQPMMIERGFLVPYAEKIKNAVKIPVIVAGRINQPEMVAEIINSGKSDMVALGRPLITDPEFVRKIKEGKQDRIAKCIACNQRCIDNVFIGKHASCLINPRAGNEIDIAIQKAAVKKKVMVIGAGPAGMAAAKTCAERGHDVILVEAMGELGGKIPLASAAPGKSEFALTGEYYTREVRALDNINIKTDVKADSDLIKKEAPDTLIIAAGSQPVIPPVEGIEGENVFTAEEIMLDKSFVPNKVVVVGGGLVGCDAALELASRGCEVTIVEMMPEIARDIGLIVKMVLLKELEEAQVKVITGKRLKKVTQEGIILEEEGKESQLAGDAVVLAVGYRSRNVESLKGIVKEEYVIGDAREVAKASDAIEEGFLIGLKV